MLSHSAGWWWFRVSPEVVVPWPRLECPGGLNGVEFLLLRVFLPGLLVGRKPRFLATWISLWTAWTWTSWHGSYLSPEGELQESQVRAALWPNHRSHTWSFPRYPVESRSGLLIVQGDRARVWIRLPLRRRRNDAVHRGGGGWLTPFLWDPGIYVHWLWKCLALKTGHRGSLILLRSAQLLTDAMWKHPMNFTIFW